MNNLISKAIAGMLVLLVALGAMILLPAGTTNYLQAWIYLITFAVSVILITVYLFIYDQKLLERRIKVGPTAERERTQKTIQAIANIFFFLVFIVAGFDYRFHWSNISLTISIIADVFVALGFYIVFLVFKENTYTSGIIEVNKDQQVISTGPYGRVRHPMYSGAIIMLSFSPIALGSYWAVLCVIPLIITIGVRLLDEEKYLVRNLPGYIEYCKKVTYRLIPGIW